MRGLPGLENGTRGTGETKLPTFYSKRDEKGQSQTALPDSHRKQTAERSQLFGSLSRTKQDGPNISGTG